MSGGRAYAADVDRDSAMWRRGRDPGPARRERADVLLVAVPMPGVDGLVATRPIAADEDLAGARAAMPTTFGPDEHVRQALWAGASGLLIEDTAPADLSQAIRGVPRSDALLWPSATRRPTGAVDRPEQPAAAGTALAGLTGREREVMAPVAAGLCGDEIAARPHLGTCAAKTHASRIMAELDARDRPQALVTAYESGPGTLRYAPSTPCAAG